MAKSNNDNEIQQQDVAITMTMILGTMLAIVIGLFMIQTPKKKKNKKDDDNNNNNKDYLGSTLLPYETIEPSKRYYEIFALLYTPIWIFLFGIIVIFQLYEQFNEWSYLKVCCGLSLPLLLQPILYPSAGNKNNPDIHRPLMERYSFKANVWIFVYSFIGNYWYTHYFYSVLKAEYTMPAHRLNNVPIALIFATHFYFTTYHGFSNILLRYVNTTYEVTIVRKILFVSIILVFSYFTAFMETLTISSYPYYSFENRDMAYTIGSAFYGIYFIVSFPAFFYFDTQIDNNNNKENQKGITIWDTFVSSCGYGMMILCLLDFVRLYLNIPLVVGFDAKSILSCS